MSFSPFDHIHIITGYKSEKEIPYTDESYNPWITDIYLSLYPDTVFYALEGSSIKNSKHHYEFYKGCMPHTKRPFKKFPTKLKKDNNSERIDLLMEVYNLSYNKAKEASEVLSDSQYDDLTRKYFKGSRKEKL